ncbi:MAG: universal stress protein [Acidobacteria bacterium]|nr:universal stress protein [Acidobacteriota bacterium]
MYKRILVAVEHSAADRTILEHIQPLARMCDASLVLIHVADGWVARAYDELQLRESKEIQEDRAYLEQIRDDLAAKGLRVESRLAMGDPAAEIIRAAAAERADLVAMATHGHRLVKDILLGATVDKVRHELKIPVLLIQARD